MKNEWTQWQPMPSPELCRLIQGPEGSGVYQVRDRVADNQLILFGIGKPCRKRMKSLFPKPYGTGTRNNKKKINYVLEFWKNLDYRTLSTENREEAAEIEREIRAKKNHLFNT